MQDTLHESSAQGSPYTTIDVSRSETKRRRIKPTELHRRALCCEPPHSCRFLINSLSMRLINGRLLHNSANSWRPRTHPDTQMIRRCGLRLRLLRVLYRAEVMVMIEESDEFKQIRNV